MGDKSGFASRAGIKLDHALGEFALDVTGLLCADFGCHQGGFTDCLLRRGAAKVCAVDTGYGVLDYRLRTDPRVVVMERTNVLHCDPPQRVELVTIDVAWTRQRFVIPAALRWLADGGRIVSLVKPHYELSDEQKRTLLVDGVLAPQHAEEILRSVVDDFPDFGCEVLAVTVSPLGGVKSARRSGGPGNREYLVLAKAR